MSTVQTIKIKIRYNEELEEYSVQWIEDGIVNAAKTYFTDDKDDAIATKYAMRSEARALLLFKIKK